MNKYITIMVLMLTMLIPAQSIDTQESNHLTNIKITEPGLPETLKEMRREQANRQKTMKPTSTAEVWLPDSAIERSTTGGGNKYYYQWNSNSQIKSETQYYLNVSSNEWRPAKKINYSYDSTGRKIEYLVWTWDGSSWKNDWRYIYIFNMYGMDFYGKQTWDGSAWTDDWRVYYTYWNTGNVQEKKHVTWNGTDWVNDYKYEIGYDDSDNLVSTVYSEWEFGDWVLKNRTTNVYYNGLIDFVINETFESNVYVKNWQLTYFYDSDSNLERLLYEEWNGSAWENVTKDIYTYNANDKKTVRQAYYWSDSSWVEDRYHTFSYNTNGYRSEWTKLNYGSDGITIDYEHRINYTYESGHVSMTYERNTGVEWLPEDGSMPIDWGGFTDEYSLTGYEGVIYYQTVTGIEKNTEMPEKFRLSQNYPNPFNPVTSIEFHLPESGYTELKVYNVLGKEIETLVSKPLSTGVHKYTFDGSELSSGIYIYKLVSKNYQAARKMMLVK